MKYYHILPICIMLKWDCQITLRSPSWTNRHGIFKVCECCSHRVNTFFCRRGRISISWRISNYRPYSIYIPRCSMYGIFTYIWYIFMVNVGKYTIHWVFGIKVLFQILKHFGWSHMLGCLPISSWNLLSTKNCSFGNRNSQRVFFLVKL